MVGCQMSFFTLNSRVIRGVAFDMDGTLVDCEPSNREAVQKAAGQNLRINWERYAGVKEVDILDGLIQEYGAHRVTIAHNDFLNACKQGYKEAIHTLQPRHGMIYLLDTLKQLQVPIVVVTNSDTEMAQKKLTHCGLIRYIDNIIGADTIESCGLKAKPSGDGYNRAAEILNIKPEELMGFEDSTTGMDALSSTEALAVHVVDHGTPEHLDAHIVIYGGRIDGILDLANQIRHENHQRFLDLSPEPRSPTHT